ncbi:MAG: hypothetical protein ACYDG4_13255 [Desulfuromonadaceae bacterium]
MGEDIWGGVDSVIGPGWSGMTGKPTNKQKQEQYDAANNATNWLTGMSQDYYGSTAGLRGDVISNLSDFMKGELDPVASSMYAPAKMTAERQYNTARDQVLSDSPAGGALFDNLTNLSAKKAGTLVDEIGKIVMDEYNKAYAMAQGSQTTAAAGAQGAASAGTQGMGALAQQQQAGAQGVGNLVKLLASLME